MKYIILLLTFVSISILGCPVNNQSIEPFDIIAQSECAGAESNPEYDPNDILTVDVCVVIYNNLISEAEAKSVVIGATSYYGDSAIKITANTIKSVTADNSIVNPTDNVPTTTMADARSRVPNSCKVVIAFIETMPLAGVSQFPFNEIISTEDSRRHTFLIKTDRNVYDANKNIIPVSFYPSHSHLIAHELGHIFGLFHPHDATLTNSPCWDATDDPNGGSTTLDCQLGACSDIESGAITCNAKNSIVRDNLMAYYYQCSESPSKNSLKISQIRRARCFIDKADLAVSVQATCTPDDNNFCSAKKAEELNCGQSQVCYENKCISRDSLKTNDKHFEWYKDERKGVTFGEKVATHLVSGSNDESNGGIFSNFKQSCTTIDCATSGKWTAVEFVNRIYSKVLNPPAGGTLTLDSCGTDPANWKNCALFDFYENGKSKSKPRINDIVVWKDANYGKGHLALVSSVTSDGVYLSQQNLTHTSKDYNMLLSIKYNEINGALVYDFDTGKNFGCQKPLGWLRLKEEKCTELINSWGEFAGDINFGCNKCSNDTNASEGELGKRQCTENNFYVSEVVKGVDLDSECYYHKIVEDCQEKGLSCRDTKDGAKCVAVGSKKDGCSYDSRDSSFPIYFILFFIAILSIRRKKGNLIL